MGLSDLKKKKKKKKEKDYVCMTSYRLRRSTRLLITFQVRLKIQYPKGAKALRKAYW